MKKSRMKKAVLLLTALLVAAFSLTACGQAEEESSQANGLEESVTVNVRTEEELSDSETGAETSMETGAETDTNTNTSATELVVRFGDDGAPFTMHLYDNDTAAAIADYVGTTDWRLPIYHYDDYENWEVMQYYDIPSRYEIPSNPETVTSEAAGTVYYSEPNRIVLFFGDAEVSGEYTPIGYFDATEEFVSAVEENPVLEGWGNKIVRISDSE